jgi:hypothetical protein
MLIEDREGIVHIALGIGKSSYPFVPDFLEEARRLGVSKRVPNNFDPSALTAGKSKFILIHPNAIPQFAYEVQERTCPKHKHTFADHCLDDLWSLSGLQTVKGKHEVSEIEGCPDKLRVTTPSSSYTVTKPKKAAKPFKYSTGIILNFPVFHFEYVNKERKVPKRIKQKILKGGFKLEVHTS